MLAKCARLANLTKVHTPRYYSTVTLKFCSQKHLCKLNIESKCQLQNLTVLSSDICQKFMSAIQYRAVARSQEKFILQKIFPKVRRMFKVLRWPSQPVASSFGFVCVIIADTGLHLVSLVAPKAAAARAHGCAPALQNTHTA